MTRKQWLAKYERMQARHRATAAEHMATTYRLDGVELLPFQVANFLTWTDGLLCWRFEVSEVGALEIPLIRAQLGWN